MEMKCCQFREDKNKVWVKENQGIVCEMVEIYCFKRCGGGKSRTGRGNVSLHLGGNKGFEYQGSYNAVS